MSAIKDARSLVQLLNKFSEADHTRQETFEYLYKLIAPGIKMRYEVIAENKPNFEPEEERKPFEYLNSADVKRVILTSNRVKADFGKSLTQQCNGLVLEYDTIGRIEATKATDNGNEGSEENSNTNSDTISKWRILAVPPMMFNPQYNVKQLAPRVANYDFYKVADGTTITLYYYEGSWRMSSTNGYEINAYKWMGEKTYEDAFNEVLAKYPRFSFDALDKQTCYTVGFRHTDFHPLLTDPNAAWFIQSVNLNTLETSYDTDIGLPFQTKLTIETPEQFYNALNEGVNSLNKYMNSFRSGTPVINYGLIMRAKDGNQTTNVWAANIFIESDLLKKIRQLMYNQKKSPKINHTNRLEYSILRAYLNFAGGRFIFINLYPQFSAQYEKYAGIISKLVARITQSYRNKNIRDTIALRATEAPTNQAICIDKLAALFIGHLNYGRVVNAFDPQSKNIIQDYIVDPRYIDIYFDIIGAI